MRRKHVPSRTCIGCRATQAKRDLVRLVRTPEGQLVIDRTGKQNGRGAYLCRRRACWESILRGSQLSKALRMDIGEEEKQTLRDFAATLAQ